MTIMKNIADKKFIVSGISFGKRTAEEESAELEQYFVETDEWRRMFSGEIDIRLVPKLAKSKKRPSC